MLLQKNRMVLLLFITVLFIISCTYGPVISHSPIFDKYNKKENRRELYTRLSYNAPDNIFDEEWNKEHSYIEISIDIYDKPDTTYSLYFCMYARANPLKDDDTELILEIDENEVSFGETTYHKISEWVTKNTTTGEIVERSGNYFTFASFGFGLTKLRMLADANSASISKIGNRDNIEWSIPSDELKLINDLYYAHMSVDMSELINN